MIQTSLLKHMAGMLAECELFGTPEQYREQTAQLRKTYGKGIFKAIVRDSQIVVGSYQANMERAYGRSIAPILRQNKVYRKYLESIKG